MSMHNGGAMPRKRRFAVTVDGMRHEVIVEELDLHDRAPFAESSPEGAAAGAGSPGTAAEPAAMDKGVGRDGGILAPMPGTVTELAVHPGDAVEAGDVLVILTAMKLENEITAPGPGIVRQLAVASGDNVNSGDRLVRIETENDAAPAKDADRETNAGPAKDGEEENR